MRTTLHRAAHMQHRTGAARALLALLVSVLFTLGVVACGTEAEDIDHDTSPDATSDNGGSTDADTTDPVSGCTTPDPRGCAALGCPSGQSCVPSGDPGCAPSTCTCDEPSDSWLCTDDCGPIMVCENAPTTCSTPDPRGCAALGCPSGQVCVDAMTDGCAPSICDCDPVTDTWACTDDCGTMMHCEPVPAQPEACPSPDPRGCAVLGCSDGEICGLSGDDGCRPSGCSCDDEDGFWICTDDCLPMMECFPTSRDDSGCSDPNPRGCAALGCPESQICVVSDMDGCVPSHCGCDADSDAWICTADCSPMMSCVDAEPDGGHCDEPNPAGCTMTGCDEGFSCEPTGAEGCMPSSCACDTDSGAWACTRDCRPVVACVAKTD